MQPTPHLCRAKNSFCPFWVKSCEWVECMTPSFASSPPSSFSHTKISQLPSALASLVTNNQNIHILFPQILLKITFVPSLKKREKYEIFLLWRWNHYFLIKIAFIPDFFSPETKTHMNDPQPGWKKRIVRHPPHRHPPHHGQKRTSTTLDIHHTRHSDLHHLRRSSPEIFITYQKIQTIISLNGQYLC